MTDLVRSVAVRLSANTSQYLAQMRAAGAETEAVSNRATRTVKANGLTQEKVFRAVGTAAKVGGAAVAYGLFEAGKQAANFADKMALVRTLAHPSATALKQLETAALHAGQQYGYTATQVADAEAELIKAGIKTKDILGGGLTGALTLAAAGQTDVAKATEIAAAAMTQFKLKGEDIPHIADLLSAGADKALGGVDQLGDALAQSGTTAHQAGLSLEQTVGTLAEFAQNAQIGEKGGTLLNQMLLQLQGPTKQARQLMEQYGFSLYKANGQMKSAPQIAGGLQKAFKGLTPEARNAALAVIFGSRAVRAANIFLADGAKTNAQWTKTINDQGFAAQQASGKLDSLSGDFRKLKAAGETALITLGSGSQAPLRQFVQHVTRSVQEVTENGDLQRWSGEITRDLEAAAKAGEPLARDLGGVLKTAGHDAKLIADAFNSLPSDVQKLIVTGGALAYGANKLGVLKPLVNTLRGGSGARGGVTGIAGAAAKGVVPVFVTNPGFGAAGGALGGAEGAAAAGGLSAGERAAVGGGLLAGLKSILTGAGTKSILTDGAKLGRLGGAGVSLFQVGDLGNEVQYKKHFSDQEMKDFQFSKSKGFNDAQAQSYMEAKAAERAAAARKKDAAATRDQTKAQSGFNALLRDPVLPHYSKMLKSLPKGVRTKVEAPGAITSIYDVKTLKKQYDLTPRQVRTLMQLVGLSEAKSGVVELRSLLASLHDENIHVKVTKTTNANLAEGTVVNHPRKGGGGVKTPASGGLMVGPGGPRDDMIPAWVSNGEYVMPADAVKHYGVATMESMRAKRYAEGGMVGVPRGVRGYITRDLDLKFPTTLKAWEQALEKSKAAIDKERAQRDDLIAQRDDFANQITSGIRQDPFSSDRPDSLQYMTGAQRTQFFQNNALRIANQNKTTGVAYEQALKTLTAKGLTGEAFKELAGSGDLQQVQAIAAESKSQLAVLQKAIGAGNAATGRASKYGAGVVFNPQIDKTNAHLATMVDLQRELISVVHHRQAARKAAKSKTASKVSTRKRTP